MIDFKILHLEDEEENIINFTRTLEIYNRVNSYDIKYESVRSIDELKNKDIQSFDFAIIDIKIKGNSTEGYSALDNFSNMLCRIPSVIYTGTDSQNTNNYALKTFVKGDDNVEEKILDYFVSIFKTGITNVLGGKGQIEKVLSKIYTNNIKYNIDEWIDLASTDKEKIEFALLRFVGHCIEDILHTECEYTFPIEAYIMPLLNEDLAPGLILKNNDKFYVVITPACDLAKHNGTRKAKDIQLCCIDSVVEIFPGDNSSTRGKRQSAIKNQYNMYHYLPKCKIFAGGLINFNKIETVNISEIEKQETSYTAVAKISLPYLKNILARFAMYYSRQGQPDILVDIDKEITICPRS